jgi:hypothetical protein
MAAVDAATAARISCSMQTVRRIALALAAACVLALAALASASSTREIGVDNAEKFQKPGCPQNCEAIGQVTGYQAQIGKVKNPYILKRKGKIVAWTIALAKPNKKQMRFFTRLYGPTPKARIAVLQLTHHGRQAKLTAQSGTFNLKPYLGSTPTFGLKKPLPVTKKSIVALTVPTWAPAFTVKLGKSYAWRSSRNASACNDVEQQAAHDKLGTSRAYGCFYRTARILYSADFVPDPKPTTPPPAK